MYCLSISNKDLSIIQSLDYIPVGLGNDGFSNQWVTDKTLDNISQKNKSYGEYTFHYWFWKNELKKITDDNWVGFCAYRRFWSNNIDKDNQNIKFKDRVLNEIPKTWKDYDVILGNKIYVDNIKWTKILKYGKTSLIRNPKAIFKKNRNIKFHFDMFHGNGVIDKAIDVLNEKDKKDFKEFVKSKKIMMKYYETVFAWLNECEKIFGFDLDGYGKIRIYGFLAERFLPFWFNKYSNCLEWPIVFNDLRKENLN